MEKQPSKSISNHNRHSSGRTWLRVEQCLCRHRSLPCICLHINLIIKFKPFHRTRTHITSLTFSICFCIGSQVQSCFHAMIPHKYPFCISNRHPLIHINVFRSHLCYSAVRIFSRTYASSHHFPLSLHASLFPKMLLPFSCLSIH